MVLPSHMPIPKVILSSSIINMDAQVHQLCANLSLLGIEPGMEELDQMVLPFLIY